ncbi:MAG: hypothetical protein R2698_07440 [Microthrixaceae bacterium]
MTPNGRRLRRVLAAIAIVVAAGFMIPVRVWFGQSTALAEAGAQERRLVAEQHELRTRLKASTSNDTIEVQARDLLSLVRPGDEPYSVSPPDTPAVLLPPVWPFDRVQRPLANYHGGR